MACSLKLADCYTREKTRVQKNLIFSHPEESKSYARSIIFIFGKGLRNFQRNFSWKFGETDGALNLGLHVVYVKGIRSER